MQQTSQDWVRTIDEGKGYRALDPASFKAMLDRAKHYAIFRAIERHTRPGERILEAGCGWAISSFALAERGRMLTALDISEKLIRNLQELRQALGDPYTSNLSLVAGDIFCLEKVRQTFDTVFSDGTYEHFLEGSDRARILVQVQVVLREGGTIVIAVPNLRNPFFNAVVDRKMPDMHVFSLRSLSEELEAGGFRVVETGYSFVNPGFEQWTKSRWMISIIRLAGAVFPILPRFLKAVCAAHLYCVARKITQTTYPEPHR